MRTIVVGVDGSAESRLALRWALEEAKSRRAPLHVVRVVSQLPPFTIENQEVLDADLAYVCAQPGEDALRGSLLVGVPAEVLVEEAQNGQLLVVGARSRTTAGAALIGSVTSAVAAHAPCPVIAVRPGHPLARPPLDVVVGVDGSDISDRAVAFAFEEAASRQLPLRVVHCWQHVDHPDPALWDERDLPADRERRRVWVAESIAGHRSMYPDVLVSSAVIEGRPQDVLVDKSEHAQLLVVALAATAGPRGFCWDR